tara:strand:- start:192 stop:380 length:189 start_codon:yes stop_codon:yes gene_type:complete
MISIYITEISKSKYLEAAKAFVKRETRPEWQTNGTNYRKIVGKINNKTVHYLGIMAARWAGY